MSSAAGGGVEGVPTLKGNSIQVPNVLWLRAVLPHRFIFKLIQSQEFISKFTSSKGSFLLGLLIIFIEVYYLLILLLWEFYVSGVIQNYLRLPITWLFAHYTNILYPLYIVINNSTEKWHHRCHSLFFFNKNMLP